jgi:hypothetical protein
LPVIFEIQKADSLRFSSIETGAGAQAERIRLNRITMTKNLDKDFKDVSSDVFGLFCVYLALA